MVKDDERSVIRIPTRLPWHVRDAAEELVASASRHGTTSATQFNGTDMVAEPGDDVTSVLKRWWLARDALDARKEGA